GFKDLIVTNGYPKDVTDHDFAAFRNESSNITPKDDLLSQIPQIKIPNYAFRNTGNIQFKNVTDDWGLSTTSFSNGAAYADLDGDGDLDYVINNINDVAFVYKNNLKKSPDNNFINIKFEGSKANINGIGAVAKIYHQDKMQTFDNTPYRGYLSCVNSDLHFGLGKIDRVDSLIIQWPDGKEQVILNVAANKTFIAKYAEARQISQDTMHKNLSFFTDITSIAGIHYRHEEFDYIDFDRQKLLPRRFSQFGPSIATGDIDANGLDDIFLGASGGNDAYLLFQQQNGKFIEKELPPPAGKDIRKPEMLGTIIFDCEGDGDMDIYVASGSNEFAPNSKNYQDRIYINDGKGNLSYDSTVLPRNYTSKSCVKATDFDKDGDLDLFVGGRIFPERYPEPVSSFLFRNDSENGRAKFTDISNETTPFLEKIGLVCDAVWTDFDNDGWSDLVVVGEWMPVRFFRNNNGKLVDVTPTSGIQDKQGWWGSIAAGDFDNDGDIDYIAGNTGLNSFFKASRKEPISIYAGDFNKDNFYDAIPSIFLPGQNGERKEFPVHVRDEMVQQIVGIRKKYNRYTDYAKATLDEILPEAKNGLKLQVNFLANSFIENKGEGKFEIRPLPSIAQFAPIYGMVIQDINEDGNLDLLLSGNDYGNEIVNGHYDALNGLVLLGDGQNNFKPSNIRESGLFIPGDGKGLIQLIVGGRYTLAATQNKGLLKMFALQKSHPIIRFNNDDIRAILHLKNGKSRLHEIYHGGSFLSQSATVLLVNSSVTNIEVINKTGITRTVEF
ncbi:MAG TPA: FG-GAP-like repeat-containing protein, partial [Flavitalea sp.]|nr:FG-GAP-like repeat-containing protein [Flavitalea sp.]